MRARARADRRAHVHHARGRARNREGSPGQARPQFDVHGYVSVCLRFPLRAATGGTVAHFKDARHFASWFGLTPKEHSSGSTRRLGRISKRGDRYLRMLLTHGARAVLRAAAVARQAGRPIDGLKDWALKVQGRANHNKAACALANKLARICYAVLRDATPYGRITPRQERKKIGRTAFAVAA